MKKAFSIALIFISLAMLGMSAWRLWQFHNANLEAKLEKLWSDDLKKLKGEGLLPEGWEQIAQVNVIDSEGNQLLDLQKLKAPIKTDEEGSNKLDVLVLSWSANDKNWVVIQYDLSDNKDNWLWELGRTFAIE